jgi:hypothetical protein
VRAGVDGFSLMVSESGAVGSSSLPAEKGWSEGDYHFVKHLWDQVRTAALYDYYFGHEADRVARWSRGADIVVAVTAPSSVVSGWALWNLTISFLPIVGTLAPAVPVGHYLWVAFGSIASFCSIIKPILRPDLSVASNTKLYTEFQALSHSAEALVRSVRIRGIIDEDIKERQSKLDDRFASIDQQRPAVLKDKLLNNCRDKVQKDWPPDRLWAPKVPGVHPRVPARP